MPKTPDNNFVEKIRRKVGKAIHQYNLIDEGDKILVGISGGIDSFVLLETLTLRRKFMPLKYQLEAVHVSLPDINEDTDHSVLEDICSQLNVPFHLIKASINMSEGNKEKSPCFLCSWNRRKEIFKLASELNCTKVTFAHHMDDSLETMLMNMTYHGEFSAIPPKLFMFKGKIDIIRPMILVRKKEIERYARIRDLQPAEGDCRYSKDNKREEFKEIVGKLSGMHKHAKENLYKSMSNIVPDHLPPGKGIQ